MALESTGISAKISLSQHADRKAYSATHIFYRCCHLEALLSERSKWLIHYFHQPLQHRIWYLGVIWGACNVKVPTITKCMIYSNLAMPLKYWSGKKATPWSAASWLCRRQSVVPLGCDISCYCFWACLLIGHACPVCSIWFDRVRGKSSQILNIRQARPIRKQWASQPNGTTG